jgi:SNF2 family DNA or RNA helicase
MNFQDYLNYSKLDAKDYQCAGVDWCIAREAPTSEHCRGGIIADEMGLGKTIMMIGTLLANFSMPNLIVLPVVLIEQWKEQFERTTGHSPLIYHGSHKKKVSIEQLQKTPIVLTTYGTVLSDSQSTDKKLQHVKWTRIICDEAHHLRNRRTKIAQSVLNLDCQIKWLITGTPIQNRINDLYSLFDILSISNKVYTNVDNLFSIIEKIVMRRTKKQVGIKIPELTIERVPVIWKNDKERQLSEEIHENFKFTRKKTDPSSSSSTNGAILSLMLYARQLCVYPSLATKHIGKMKELGIASPENMAGLSYNSKMDGVINKILERKYNKNKKIIFTNFHGEIDHLKERLRDNGLVVESIDGRITKRKRQFVLHQELDVLILQIKTGNEGLNLQKYNEVYFVTPDWNPKMEEQAIARCHRLGQTKPVHVFRFVMSNATDTADVNMKNTQNIEMYSEMIQHNKREIENSILCKQ